MRFAMMIANHAQAETLWSPKARTGIAMAPTNTAEDNVPTLSLKDALSIVVYFQLNLYHEGDRASPINWH